MHIPGSKKRGILINIPKEYLNVAINEDYVKF